MLAVFYIIELTETNISRKKPLTNEKPVALELIKVLVALVIHDNFVSHYDI